MTSIDRLRHLVDTAKSRAAEGQRSTDRKTASRQRAALSHGESAKIGEQAVLEHIRNALSSRPEGSTETNWRQGQRAFIESTLLASFGIQLADDPRFLALVEQVDATISQDPDLFRQVEGLLASIDPKVETSFR